MDVTFRQQRNSSSESTQEALKRTVDLILWSGIFLFVAFVIAIWLYLGKSAKSNFRKIDEEDEESGRKSPIRQFSTNVQRTHVLSRVPETP